MNDETKIRALMVYFRHWGSEQARMRRAADGIRKTTTIIRRDFDGLRFCDMSRTDFWGGLASSFLEGMEHYTPIHYEEDDGDFRRLCARARFASDIGVSFFSPHVASASDEKMRRISAILALPPISSSSMA